RAAATGPDRAGAPARWSRVRATATIRSSRVRRTSRSAAVSGTERRAKVDPRSEDQAGQQQDEGGGDDHRGQHQADAGRGLGGPTSSGLGGGAADVGGQGDGGLGER